MPERAPDELPTARLLLRRWRADDHAPLAAINGDPEVMRYIGSGALSRAASDELVGRLEDEWRRCGHGLWAIERRADGRLLGFCGLAVPLFLSQVLPAVEVGWRLARDAWGHGYATEAAQAAVAAGWAIGLRQLIAIVHPDNERSLAVAERLGMRVTGRTRHAASGWEVLVLRLDRPPAPDDGERHRTFTGGGGGRPRAMR
ncbi:GNAT family N-acetyltransferase [Patulibacter defluvii]|uniref:GNAT family N-acetyltransferase n=1 Tax=Patulibacter defluvii TaxID=3095358 RepID=UPI002A7538EA|nr:GNAT family N-acetyltransferase [Patulibacter sp. DM4]